MTAPCLGLVSTALVLLLTGRASGMMAQNPKILAPKEELRISADAHDLSQLNGVAIGPGGVLAIAQAQDQTIRIFSADGKPQTTIGRRGEGPGEFVRIGAFGWSGDSVWAFDLLARRLSIFSSAGKLGRTVAIPVTMGGEGGNEPASKTYHGFTFQRLASNGALLFRASQPTGRTTGPGVNTSWLVWGSSNGKIDRPLTQLPTDNCMILYPGGGRAIPACPQVLSGVSPAGDRVTIVETLDASKGSYRLTGIDATGRTRFSRMFNAPVRMLSRGQLDSLSKELGKMPPAMREVMRGAGVDLPKAWPVVDNLRAGNDGTVWLMMSRDRNRQKQREWRGYDQDGNPLGVLLLADDANIETSNSQYVLVSESDADGSESLVRYRIHR